MQICSDRACEIKRTKTVVVLSFKTFSVRKRMFWGILLFPFLLVSPQSNEKQGKHKVFGQVWDLYSYLLILGDVLVWIKKKKKID